MCVRARVHVCVRPVLFALSPLLQNAIDQVAKVTFCVDRFTSVLITTQQFTAKTVCVHACVFVRVHVP